MLTTPQLADRLVAAGVDRDARVERGPNHRIIPPSGQNLRLNPLDWNLLLDTYPLVLIAIGFGAFVARATGVGFALVVVAALLALPQMDQPTALYVAAPLSLLNLSFVLLALHRHIPWPTVGQISLPLALGFAAGLVFGLYVPKVWMLACGLFIVAYTLLSLLRPPNLEHPTQWDGPMSGGINGADDRGTFLSRPAAQRILIGPWPDWGPCARHHRPGWLRWGEHSPANGIILYPAHPRLLAPADHGLRSDHYGEFTGGVGSPPHGRAFASPADHFYDTAGLCAIGPWPLWGINQCFGIDLIRRLIGPWPFIGGIFWCPHSAGHGHGLWHCGGRVYTGGL